MSSLSAPYVLGSNGRPVDLRSVPVLFPNEFHASIQEQLKDFSFIVRCASDKKIARRLTPHLFKPFQIGFESAASDNERFGAELRRPLVELHFTAFESAVAGMEFRDFGIIEDGDTALRRRRVVGVHQCFSAAQEERVRPAQMQRAFERLLKSDTIAFHPFHGFE